MCVHVCVCMCVYVCMGRYFNVCACVLSLCVTVYTRTCMFVYTCLYTNTYDDLTSDNMFVFTVIHHPVFCHNNATKHTLHCIYDNCFEDHLHWTVENGLTVSHTTRNYSHHISHMIFNYSSLPYHSMSVFYKHYGKDSLLGKLWSLHHCYCSFSVTLDVSG